MIRATKKEMFGVLTETGFKCWGDMKDGWEASHPRGFDLVAKTFPNGEWVLKIRNSGVFSAFGYRSVQARDVADLIGRITDSIGDKGPLDLGRIVEVE